MEKEIKSQLEYCLNCKVKPCASKGCPLGNNIPEIIYYAKNGKMEEAYFELLKTSILGSVCGRICPHYSQCMGSCIRGIKGESVHIGEIEKFVSDYGLENKLYEKINKTNELVGKNIAIIGGGPAGMTCAYFLVMSGANVTIYEKHDKLGGILVHGIPEFRLNQRSCAKNDTVIN